MSIIVAAYLGAFVGFTLGWILCALMTRRPA